MWYEVRVPILLLFVVLVASLSVQERRRKRQVSRVIITSPASRSNVSELHRIRRQSQDAERAGCRMPQLQQNGHFSHSKRRCLPDDTIPVCRITPGSPVPHNWPLYHSCNPGYVLNPSRTTASVCLDGVWRPALPGCIRVMSANCLTPNGSDGQCMDIKSCPLLLDLLREPVWREYLVESQCGAKENNVVKVCCPAPIHSVPDNCRTPGNVPGQCINIKSCPALLDFPQKLTEPGWIEYLYKSQCGFKDNNVTEVCCPTTAGDELPDTSVCGRPYESAHRPKRVVGGRPSDLGDWPWMAALGFKSSSKAISWECGGSLISNRHVLTAAQCLVASKYKLTVVRLGDVYLDDSDTDRATATDVAIEKTIVHENYNSSAKTFDIGLVVLKHWVDFTELIRPICVPAPNIFPEDITGYSAYVTGWGTLAYMGPKTTALQEAELDITDQNVCANAYKDIKKNIIVDDRVICAYSEVGKDTCQGDSGGPLMLLKKLNFYLIGIVSAGHKCAEPGYPGVYTKVSVYFDWIKRMMR